jgi:hypothetical protein
MTSGRQLCRRGIQDSWQRELSLDGLENSRLEMRMFSVFAVLHKKILCWYIARLLEDLQFDEIISQRTTSRHWKRENGKTQVPGA